VEIKSAKGKLVYHKGGERGVIRASGLEKATDCLMSTLGGCMGGPAYLSGCNKVSSTRKGGLHQTVKEKKSHCKKREPKVGGAGIPGFKPRKERPREYAANRHGLWKRERGDQEGGKTVAGKVEHERSETGLAEGKGAINSKSNLQKEKRGTMRGMEMNQL